MSGVSDLTTLLATMEPELSETELVFCTVPDMELRDAIALAPAGVFREREGLSLIIARATAEIRGMPFDTVLKAITLNVHSSLEAVGLTATITGRLAQHGISANVVAAVVLPLIIRQRLPENQWLAIAINSRYCR